MRKTYQMILALAMIVLGATNAMAVTADLDPAMFKAWDGFGKDAKVVADPEPCPNSDGTTSPFGCSYALYESLGAGGMVYGNTNVYYLWYADVTGTKTITFEGTPGLQLRVLMNRPEPAEGGTDPHGGQTVEQNVTIGEDGKAVLDVSSMEFVHINAIKLGWGSPAGTIRKIELEGSVRPVTGWVDMINNGDFESDDLESFPVSKNGPNNGNTANDRPEIVAGAGPDGSRAGKVVSDENATETWSTQFYLKPNEPLAEGTQWRIIMDIKADRAARITTSAQGRPRDWQSGFENDNSIGGFDVTNEWATYEFSGVVTHNEAFGNNGIGALGSIAFDLNNDKETSNNFFFDNILFQVYEEPTPLAQVKAEYESDVLRFTFGKENNIKDLVKAAGGERLIYPNDCVTITVNGEPTTLMSVEARPDGYFWVFIDEGFPEQEGQDLVVVNFVNPEDDAHKIMFTGGKYAGEPIPSFTGLVAVYNDETAEDGTQIADHFSYLYGTPSIVSADPEDGGFNLPNDLTEFKFTFDHAVDVKALDAKLGKEKLTVTPAEGYSKNITLSRAAGALADGIYKLVLSNVKGDKDLGESGTYTLTLSFGPVTVDPNDQPRDILPLSYMNETQEGYIPVGFKVVVDGLEGEVRTSEGGAYSGGPRTFNFGEGGDFTKGLYTRNTYIEYGSIEGYELPLVADSKYKISFNTARWKASGQWFVFDIINPDGEVVKSWKIENNPDVNGSKNAVKGSTAFAESFIPETSGNFILRWSVTNGSGEMQTGGYVEALLANVLVKYVPNVPGVEELALVNGALDAAKASREANSDARYDGSAFTALDNIIKQYDGVTFTAPSVCQKAAAELEAATKFMNDHRSLCDDYDKLPATIQEIINTYGETKFATTDVFANVKAMADKYITKSDEESLEFKILKDDAELKDAVAELKDAIAWAIGHGEVARSGKGMFTVGEPKMGDWNATCTGVAVLVERIRLGVEALKSLGVAEDDALIVAGDNALTDDDALAESIQKRITMELYSQLKNADNTLFTGVVDEATLEEVTPTYNMTTFIKNPCLYDLNPTTNYSEENVPGWTVQNFRGISTGWSDLGTAKIPCGIMFSNWGGDFTVSQNVENLPAGVYTLKMGFGERDNEASAEGSYIFAATSTNVDDSLKADCPVVGQAFPEKNVIIENILVTDGKLLIGVQAGASSHAFFNDTQLLLTAAAEGFDYGKAYEDVLSGIDVSTVTPVKVRRIELFDLNGRRINAARKGVAIMRKHMDDGTIKTEKVVNK